MKKVFITSLVFAFLASCNIQGNQDVSTQDTTKPTVTESQTQTTNSETQTTNSETITVATNSCEEYKKILTCSLKRQSVPEADMNKMIQMSFEPIEGLDASQKEATCTQTMELFKKNFDATGC